MLRHRSEGVGNAGGAFIEHRLAQLELGGLVGPGRGLPSRSVRVGRTGEAGRSRCDRHGIGERENLGRRRTAQLVAAGGDAARVRGCRRLGLEGLVALLDGGADTPRRHARAARRRPESAPARSGSMPSRRWRWSRRRAARRRAARGRRRRRAALPPLVSSRDIWLSDQVTTSSSWPRTASSRAATTRVASPASSCRPARPVRVARRGR